jgi:hypothetical protein
VGPFSFRGHDFAGGVHPLAAPIFTEALRRLVDVGGLVLPDGPSTVSGNWGYEARGIIGSPTVKSFHAYAIALDVAAPWNPLGVANPPASPHRLPDNTDQLVRPLGILWGGAPEFSARYDRMHLELHLAPSEIGGAVPPVAAHPFPLPTGWYYGPASGPMESVSGTFPGDAPYRPGLKAAQHALGTPSDGLYGPNTARAARTYQAAHGLQADGLIGALTWASLFR